MGPIAKNLKKKYEEYINWRRSIHPHSFAILFPNAYKSARDPRTGNPFDVWEHNYLFPEILISQLNGHNWHYPCQIFSVETVLRVLSEVGILD